MNSFELNRSLRAVVRAARSAGKLMRQNLMAPKKINAELRHDIKLELDVRCQKLIQAQLLKAFPASSVLGEEGDTGMPDAPLRWVIDPIDGTVNYTYGIPHACTSIALQERQPTGEFLTVVGVVYDPFSNELWTAIRGKPAHLNGKRIAVSPRSKLGQTIMSVGISKGLKTVQRNVEVFNRLVWQVRKLRMMGSAALALTYVASGRLDAYIESGLSLWDIAAGGLIIQCAGGDFWNQLIPGTDKYRVIANNGLLRKKIQRVVRLSE